MRTPERGPRDFENHEAVVLVLHDEGDRILMLFHAKFGFWTLPLGKAEIGQTPEEAAAAEAYEECGIEIRELQRLCTGTRVYHHLGMRTVTFFNVFEVLGYQGNPVNREPDKHPDMRFMSLSEIRMLTSTSDGTRMYLDYLNSLQAPTNQTEGKALERPLDLAGRFIPEAARVSLSGSSGAGKTTFANYLRERLCARVHIESVRPWLASKGGLKYSQLNDFQFMELQMHLLDEYEHSEANVFDRSPLDSLVYSRRVAHLLDLNGFRARALELLRGFSAIVFFPPYSPYLRSDGVRIADLVHQAEVSANICVEACNVGLRQKMMVYDHTKSIRENAHDLLEKIELSP
jgi:ADP-ribose pyrophosphatase YjhB (NUDIX family)/predicted ATPase